MSTNKALLVTITGLLFSLSLYAQRVIINDDWQFVRLTEEQSQGEIQNQGTDWNSQYNVKHVNAGGGSLAVSPAVLQKEFRQLSNSQWQPVKLPHTSFVEPLVVQHQWQGICYYRKKLSIRPKDEDKLLWLEFGAAMQLADVWVNGQHLAQHAGGYTPFVVDVTGVLKSGKPNEILVRLDNRNNSLIPPGKPLEELDFSFYGGLYRDVKLIVKNPVHITHAVMANETAGGGIFVTYPKVSEQEAVVQVKTQVANESDDARDVELCQTLLEWSKEKGVVQKVATETRRLTVMGHQKVSEIQHIDVPSPKLWSPDSPHLYVLRTVLKEGKKVQDVETTRIGIRQIEMSREKGFVINGKPLRLEGSNRHQEYPYVGYALSREAQYRDIYQIRNNGFNVVRLGHYPQDPSVLDACDELGLLAIEPIPGWQFFNQSKTFIDNTYRDIRDLIRRDRNHPSIVMWETTLNESWPPTEWKDQAVKIAHEEYPGCYAAGDSYGYDGFDVCYNDWEEGFNRPNKTSKPGFIREYYDYEFGGHYSTTRKRRGDGDRGLMQNAWNAQWSHNRYRAYYPWTMGQAVWSMYDYNRGCCDNICHSGVADIFRLPKFSLHYFRTQTTAGSYTPSGSMPYEVFVNSHWLRHSSDTLQVYGNVDEVELQLNGKNIARKKPDNGPTTQAYVAQPDGGNATNVKYPPFTFFHVKWQEGELKAIGYHGGRQVAEHIVRTPGKADHVSIDYFESGKPASKDDVLIVYVRLRDKQGTLCFGDNTTKVKLEVLQGGQVEGADSIAAEGGIASFVVSTGKGKKLVLKANADELSAVKAIRLAKKRTDY